MPRLAWVVIVCMMALPAPIPAIAKSACSLAEAQAAMDERDAELAIALLLPCAEGGDAEAQYLLGLINHGGIGQPPNYEEAVNWYRLAVEQNHPNALYNLAGMYSSGRAGVQDFAEAARLYLLAAELGHVGARRNLAVLYENGRGVDESLEEAAHWYALAAEAGDLHSQFTLGMILAADRGPLADIVLGGMWIHIAAVRGHVEARLAQPGLEARMTPEEIIASRQRGWAWLGEHPE